MELPRLKHRCSKTRQEGLKHEQAIARSLTMSLRFGRKNMSLFDRSEMKKEKVPGVFSGPRPLRAGSTDPGRFDGLGYRRYSPSYEYRHPAGRRREDVVSAIVEPLSGTGAARCGLTTSTKSARTTDRPGRLRYPSGPCHRKAVCLVHRPACAVLFGTPHAPDRAGSADAA